MIELDLKWCVGPCLCPHIAHHGFHLVAFKHSMSIFVVPRGRVVALHHRLTNIRNVHLASFQQQCKAFAYSENGAPSKVIKVHSYLMPTNITSGHVHVKFLGAPINPADINQIEGFYEAKPVFRRDLGNSNAPLAIGGNEGVVEILRLSEDGDPAHHNGFQVGDWAIMGGPSIGTWRSLGHIPASQLIRIRNDLTISQAATISVNPCTAYRMLKDFVKLEEGDWIIQNGANSSVGQWVIQLANIWGLRTINICRSRPDFELVKKHLKGLGATHVITTDDLPNIPELTNGERIKLGLNCVGGRMTTSMAKHLRPSGHLVTYGAMSRQTLNFPNSLFIFGDLHCHGFWVSKWFESHPEERKQMLEEIASYYVQGKVQEPLHEITRLNMNGDRDDILLANFHGALERANTGFLSKKQVIRFE